MEPRLKVYSLYSCWKYFCTSAQSLDCLPRTTKSRFILSGIELLDPFMTSLALVAHSEIFLLLKAYCGYLWLNWVAVLVQFLNSSAWWTASILIACGISFWNSTSFSSWSATEISEFKLKMPNPGPWFNFKQILINFRNFVQADFYFSHLSKRLGLLLLKYAQ